MTHDVFISYSSKDKPVADKICAGLEARGIACWMAPRDIQPGVNWAGAILDAIEQSRAMIVLLTENAVASNQIEHEVERAHGLNIPLIALSLQQVKLARSLALYLPASQWLDAGSGRLEPHLDKLADAVRRLSESQLHPEEPALRPAIVSRLPRQSRRPLIVALTLIAGAAFTAWLLWPAPHWTVESSRPFISTLALEGEPAFSPDGKMLAYTSGPDPLSRKIYVRNVAGGDGIRVTSDAYRRYLAHLVAGRYAACLCLRQNQASLAASWWRPFRRENPASRTMRPYRNHLRLLAAGHVVPLLLRPRRANTWLRRPARDRLHLAPRSR